jgi:hypothetical protein
MDNQSDKLSTDQVVSGKKRPYFMHVIIIVSIAIVLSIIFISILINKNNAEASLGEVQTQSPITTLPPEVSTIPTGIADVEITAVPTSKPIVTPKATPKSTPKSTPKVGSTPAPTNGSREIVKITQYTYYAYMRSDITVADVERMSGKPVTNYRGGVWVDVYGLYDASYISLNFGFKHDKLTEAEVHYLDGRSEFFLVR